MSALVQTKDFSPPGVSSYTATMAAAFTVGNTVVVDFGGATGAYITAITGGGVTTWNQATLSAGQGTGPTYTGIWYGVVTSSGSTSIAVTYSKATSTFDPLVVSEWTGSLVVDVVSSTGGTRTTGAVTPTVTPSAAGDVAVATVRLQSGTVSNTMPSPWTALGSRAGHSGNASAYQASASASAQSLNWAESFSNPDYWASSIALLKPGGTTQSGAATLSGSGTLTGSASANIKAATSLSASGSISATISGPRFEVVGHSYAVGEGLSDTTLRSSTVLANDRGYTEVNYGVGGSGATLDHNSLGGWATVANSLVRNGSSPYPKQTDYGLVWYGINDVGHLPTWGAKDQMFFSQGMRFVISRMCASKIFDDADSSIVYSGFSSNSINSDYGTGATDRRSTAGGTVTISVPSDFPGGTVAVYPVTYNNQGATWTFTVDGVAAGSLNLDATGESYSSGSGGLSFGFAQRFTGLSAGAHTIVCTVTGVTGATYFDSWAIEASVPPIVLVPGQFKLSSTGYANYTTHVPTDADIDALNSNIQSVVAEFPSQVRYVDLSSLDKMTDMQANQLEPDETGYSQITTLLEAAITGSTKTGSSSVSGSGSLSATGLATRRSTASLSGSSTFVATGNLTALGAVSVSGSSSLVAGGTHLYIGQSSLSGSGTLSATGKRYAQPTTSLTANGTLTGTLSFVGVSTLTGSGSLSATPTISRKAQSTLSGSGTLTSSGTRIGLGSFSGSGNGTLIGSSKSTLYGASSLNGSGALTATSGSYRQPAWLFPSPTLFPSSILFPSQKARTVSASAVLSASSSLNATETVTRLVSVSLSGQTNLTAHGSAITSNAASLSGSGTLNAISLAIRITGATFPASSALSANSSITTYGVSSLSGSGTISATPTILLQSGEADLIGSGTLLSYPGLIRSATGILSGLGSLIAYSGVIQTGSGSLSAQSLFNINPTVTRHGQTSLSSQGVIDFNAIITGSGRSALAGTGTLFGSVTRNVLGESNLSGVSTLLATAKVTYNGETNLIGVSNLSAGAGAFSYKFATANLDGSSTAIYNSQIILSAVVEISGNGASSGSGTRIRLGNSNLSTNTDISADGLRYAGGFSFLDGSGSVNARLGQIVQFNGELSGISGISPTGMAIFYGLSALSGSGNFQPSGSLIFAARSDLSSLGNLVSTGDVLIGGIANLAASGDLTGGFIRFSGGSAQLSGLGHIHADTYIQTWDGQLIRLYLSGKNNITTIDTRMNRNLTTQFSTGRLITTQGSFVAIPGPVTKIISTEESEVSMHNNQEVLIFT